MIALVESPLDTEVLQASQTKARVLPVSVMLGMLLSHDMLYVIVGAVPVAPVIVGAEMSGPPIVYVAPLTMDDNVLVTTGHVMDTLVGPGGPDTVL
jgi:hypothetical protein